METGVTVRYIKMSPTKIGVVLDPIRGRNIQETFAISQYTPKDTVVVIDRVLKLAVASTEGNREMGVERLYVAEAFVGVGPTLKRFRSMDYGKASRINKRTSNITLVVKEKA